MKTLPFHREDPPGQKVTVECADGEVSVYSRCAYCSHCNGVQVGRRTMPSPQKEKIEGVHRGTSTDDDLMTSAMMFNTLIRDGSAILCDDDENEGYRPLYHYF